MQSGQIYSPITLYVEIIKYVPSASKQVVWKVLSAVALNTPLKSDHWWIVFLEVGQRQFTGIQVAILLPSE